MMRLSLFSPQCNVKELLKFTNGITMIDKLMPQQHHNNSKVEITLYEWFELLVCLAKLSTADLEKKALHCPAPPFYYNGRDGCCKSRSRARRLLQE